MVTAFDLVGGAPTTPWRDDGDVSGPHMEGGGSALPGRVVLAAVRTGSQRGVDRGQPYWLQQGHLGGCFDGSDHRSRGGCGVQVVSRDVKAMLEGHLTALRDAKLTAVNSLALVRKPGDRIWRRPWIGYVCASAPFRHRPRRPQAAP